MLSSKVKKMPDPYGLQGDISNGFWRGCWTTCREEIVYYLFDAEVSNFYFAYKPKLTIDLAKSRLKKAKSDASKMALEIFIGAKPKAKDMTQNIAAFIQIAEDRLNLSECSVIHPTKDDEAIYIHLSPFWRRQKIRFSFFTALLRAAMFYTPDSDFDSVLYTNKYARGTMFASMRFLDGYFNASKNLENEGWYDAFYEANCTEIIKGLKKPTL